jgi:hypothetical protein
VGPSRNYRLSAGRSRRLWRQFTKDWQRFDEWPEVTAPCGVAQRQRPCRAWSQ